MDTPVGKLTFGLHADLNEALGLALEGMVDLLEGRGYGRKEAIMLASLTVDFRVTQVANQVFGVHAILPPGALDNCAPAHDERTILQQQAGALADDERLSALRKEIYRQRGRPETNNGLDDFE